jgi:hypothetical protein
MAEPKLYHVISSVSFEYCWREAGGEKRIFLGVQPDAVRMPRLNLSMFLVLNIGTEEGRPDAKLLKLQELDANMQFNPEGRIFYSRCGANYPAGVRIHGEMAPFVVFRWKSRF